MTEYLSAGGNLVGTIGTVPITATIPEFRRISGISRSKIYELLDEGRIESVYVGARRLIVVSSYLQFIDRQRQTAKADGP